MGGRLALQQRRRRELFVQMADVAELATGVDDHGYECVRLDSENPLKRGERIIALPSKSHTYQR